MNVDITSLPDNVSILKEIIHSQVQTYSTLEQKYGVTERDLTNLRSRYHLLEEQLRLLKDKIYGRKSEKFDIVPAKMQVIRNIRYKYACKSCEGVDSEGGAVKIAPLPPQLIPQGIATPGLLAQVATSKYAEALPLYRQEKIFERMGVDLSRATMANWMVEVGSRCEPLMDLLQKDIRLGPVINMDVTSQVIGTTSFPDIRDHHFHDLILY